MYSVTMMILRDQIASSTAIGAMSATFAVIGTLVGTYFGIKAGLDGQDKVKETVSRIRVDEDRSRDAPPQGARPRPEGGCVGYPQDGGRNRACLSLLAPWSVPEGVLLSLAGPRFAH